MIKILVPAEWRFARNARSGLSLDGCDCVTEGISAVHRVVGDIDVVS